jgi:D-alanyl-lipoteichoic acid acyltransferase DltB (MBOAT superfamily)
MIIFVVSGFWHGANWTFIVWGALNAIYIMPLMVIGNNRNHLDVVAQGKNWPSIREFGAMLLTFSATVFAWIFFRAENIAQAVYIIKKIFSDSFYLPVKFMTISDAWVAGVFVLVMILIDWKGREYEHTLKALGLKWNKYVRYAFYYAIMGVIIYMFWNTEEQQFIYFQF